MLAAVETSIDEVDIFFAVAAVADYTPAAPLTQKMKKTESALSIALVPTVDILATIAARAYPPFCVGFAAESDNIVENAANKRIKKRIPMIVANHATTAIGADNNTVTIIDADGQTHLQMADKATIAHKIVEHAVNLMLKMRKLDTVNPSQHAN